MSAEPTPRQKRRGPGLWITCPVESASWLSQHIHDYLGHFPAAKLKIEMRDGELLMSARGWHDEKIKRIA